MAHGPESVRNQDYRFVTDGPVEAAPIVCHTARCQDATIAGTRAVWTRTWRVALRAARAADAASVGRRALVHERRGDQRVRGGAATRDGGLSRSAPPGARAHGQIGRA